MNKGSGKRRVWREVTIEPSEEEREPLWRKVVSRLPFALAGLALLWGAWSFFDSGMRASAAREAWRDDALASRVEYAERAGNEFAKWQSGGTLDADAVGRPRDVGRAPSSGHGYFVLAAATGCFGLALFLMAFVSIDSMHAWATSDGPLGGRTGENDLISREEKERWREAIRQQARRL